jgi:hypothetical protein
LICKQINHSCDFMKNSKALLQKCDFETELQITRVFTLYNF